MATLRDLVVSIGLKTNRTVRQLDRIENQVDDIRDNFVHLGRDVDHSSKRVRLFSSNGVRSLGTMAKSTIKLTSLTGGLTLALSAAIAASAPLVAGTMGLAASFASAGIGALAFGAVAAGVLKPIFEDAENLTKAQRGARKELEGFQKFWGDFTKQFETPIFEAFGKSLSIAKGILEGLAPTITNVSGVIVDLLTGMDTAIKNGGMNDFFSWLEDTAATSLQNFATIGGNAMTGFFDLLQAFQPIGTSTEEWLIRLTEKFKNWSATLSENQGFQNFIEYAKTNAPILGETINNILTIVGDVITGLAPLGEKVLTTLRDMTGIISEVTPIIETVATTIADNWTPIIQTVIALGTAVGSFAVMMKGLQIIGMINTLFIAWRTGTVMQTLAMWGLNTAMLANPITWIIAGIAALIGIGVLLWQNWDTITAAAGKLWDNLKEAWTAIGDGFSAAWDMIKSAAATAINGMIGNINNLIGVINKIPGVNVPLVAEVNYVEKGKKKADGSHATGLFNVPFDNYTANLHAGETVLTAQQSGLMRSLGILTKKGNRPEVNLTSKGSTSTTPVSTSNTTTTNNNSSSPTFAPVIHVYGGNAGEVEKELERFWNKMNVQAV